MIPPRKICGICGVEKEKECFSIRRKPKGYTWLRMECKSCENDIRRHRYKTIPEVKEKRRAVARKSGMKNRDKRLAYYKRYEIENKEKKRENYKKRYENNKEKIKAERRAYYRRNSQKHIAVVKQYTQNNKEKILAAKRRNHKIKREVDLQYRLVKLLRGRVLAAIKSKGKKCLKTRELTGCSMDYLRQHLECQFKEGMTWGNQGMFGWHIDHIIPCDAFDLTNEAEQKKCFHYSNLQPLWCHENWEKSNKVA